MIHGRHDSGLRCIRRAKLHLTIPPPTRRFAAIRRAAMQSVLSSPEFQNEEAAFAYVEAKLWPNGPVCPKCGVIGQAGRLLGKTSRPGMLKCYACRKPFTVRMGTVFESSHVPMHIWLQVIYLMNSSKKGFSTRQIQRTIG